MKVVLLGDTHLGARNGNQRFHTFFELFYSDVLFPYMHKHKISQIFQLGDLWDQRKFIHVASAAEANRYFFDNLRMHGFHMTTLLGNHDISFRNSCEVNSSEILLGGYSDCITVINKPTDVDFGATRALVIPWICDENAESVKAAIRLTSSPFCLSHLELQGFEALRGHTMETGMDPSIFKVFDCVFTGHYHHRHAKGNVLYVGTPYEMTWADYDDPKGFHVLDTVTGDLEFIQNPYQLFKKVAYSDDMDVDLFNFEPYRACYVRVAAASKKNFHKFEKFLDKLMSVRPYDVKVVDEVITVEVDEAVEAKEDGDTVTLIKDFVNKLTVTDTVDKEAVRKYIHNLYIEAQLNYE